MHQLLQEIFSGHSGYYCFGFIDVVVIDNEIIPLNFITMGDDYDDKYWTRKFNVFSMMKSLTYNFEEIESILESAAKSGRTEIIHYFRDYIDENNITLIIDAAAYHGQLETLKYLIKQEHNLPVPFSHILINAAGAGQNNIITYFYQTHPSEINHWLLQQAGGFNQLHTVKYLTKLGVHDKDNRALRYVGLFGHLDIIKYLVRMGGNIYSWDHDVYRSARDQGFDRVVRYINYPEIEDEIDALYSYLAR